MYPFLARVRARRTEQLWAAYRESGAWALRAYAVCAYGAVHECMRRYRAPGDSVRRGSKRRAGAARRRHRLRAPGPRSAAASASGSGWEARSGARQAPGSRSQEPGSKIARAAGCGSSDKSALQGERLVTPCPIEECVLTVSAGVSRAVSNSKQLGVDDVISTWAAVHCRLARRRVPRF